MNYFRGFQIATETFCVAILSICGIVTFSNSTLYSSFVKWISQVLPTDHLLILIFFIFFILGSYFVIIRNEGGGLLVITVFILSLPTIFSFNNINLLKIFGSTAQFTPKITFNQMVSIGTLSITAYLLLDLINQSKINFQKLKTHQAPENDLKILLRHQLPISIILAGGALLISLIIASAARVFEYLIPQKIYILSWWIVPLALFFIFGLGIFLFWISTRKNN